MTGRDASNGPAFANTSTLVAINAALKISEGKK